MSEPRGETAGDVTLGVCRGGLLLQPKPFVLAALPRKCDPAQREITRLARIGASSFLRVTYIATDRRHPLPYGADRALLAWITTLGHQTGEVRFSAITDYFRAFGLSESGTSYRLFRERFDRIANLAVRIESFDDSAHHTNRLFVLPHSSEPQDLLAPYDETRYPAFLSSKRYGFSLERDLWMVLRGASVPAPLGLLRQFHDAPLGWDLAQLLLYRCFAARSESVLPWDDLQEQLGSEDSNRRRFRARIEQALAVIRAFDRTCPARSLPGHRGLHLAPWRPVSIPPKSVAGPPEPQEP